MKALNIIVQREFLSRVKTKAFILTTIFAPLFFIGITLLPAVIATMSSNDDINRVYVIDDTGLYSSLFESSKKYEFIKLDDAGDRPKGQASALLQISGDLSTNPDAVTFFSEKQQPPRELTSYINNVLTEAVKNQKVERFTQDNNVDSRVVTELQQILKSKDKIRVSSMRWDETGKETETLGEVASVTGTMLTFCMFFFIMMYGSMVMQSVVEEKSNRIIEVIISSVRPYDLMMGKIIGVGLVGLFQLAVWFVIGGGAMIFAKIYFGLDIDTSSAADMQQTMNMMQNNPEISSALSGVLNINWLQVISCFILYFIGGYLLFASLFAMFGSAANDAQEAQQLMMPVTIFLILAFYIGFAAARNPEGGTAFWCSLIPFTSPVVMMVRAPFEVPVWELALSILLLYVTAILMVKFAAKIYRVGILMYGKKVTLPEMFKWLKYK